MEKLMWSLPLPGFGQLLNKQYIKGIILLFLEFLINMKAHFNQVILLSFNGHIQSAIQQTNYQWLMFYPCFYMFAAWDAYREDSTGKSKYLFFPYVFSAFSVTVGLIYSPVFNVRGVLFGPVWLPILSLIPGIGVGLALKKICENLHHNKF